MTLRYDVIVVGAGAAGLMCAIEAGKRNRSVCLIDHSKRIGTKIRISGGGRCNFTNLHASPSNYLSDNPHFCKSALKQYTQYDFIDLVTKHGIAFHEKKLGQLFCDDSAQNIIDMLLKESDQARVKRSNPTTVHQVIHRAEERTQRFILKTSAGELACESLVIATGGLSIPKSGATPFGYEIARQFGLGIINTRAALVPLTFQGDLLDACRALSGLSVDASVSVRDARFAEGLLFTHRGLSGPSILQISSYWREKMPVAVDLMPQLDFLEVLKQRKKDTPKQTVQTVISEHLPKRLAQSICDWVGQGGRLAELSESAIQTLAEAINRWQILPGGTEGYRTAEVTLGGVDTHGLSSKTMAAKSTPGLYFIGEVVDVTGHLGGFNFQWAWSSGFVAGQNV